MLSFALVSKNGILNLSAICCPSSLETTLSSDDTSDLLPTRILGMVSSWICEIQFEILLKLLLSATE